jgi:two-component sensor histidine kinase
VIAAGMSLVFFRLYRKNQRISRRNADLVKEQNHRVKNNLQVVSSLLSLQSKRLSDETAKKAIEESRLRVQSMAIIHQRLYDGDKLAEVNLNEYIQELAEGVLDAYGYSTVRAEFTIDKISLTADKAVPLGLILNELITNSCKYAFPTTENPELSISCYRTGNEISLLVADNGAGWTDTYSNRFTGPNPGRTDAASDGLVIEQVTVKKSSFGMQLIQSQVEQLYGVYRFRVGHTGLDKGLLFSMEFNV